MGAEEEEKLLEVERASQVRGPEDTRLEMEAGKVAKTFTSRWPCLHHGLLKGPLQSKEGLKKKSLLHPHPGRTCGLYALTRRHSPKYFLVAQVQTPLLCILTTK